MSENTPSTASPSPIPADDLQRPLAVAKETDDASLDHVALAGDVYTILLSGSQTAGRYCLIDMQVRPGGGPPPHRHDFEEMFTILAGEIELIFRGETSVAGVGTTVNIPANAPHAFRNTSKEPARMLCMCTPAMQEEYFLAVGDRVPSSHSTPPELSEAEQAQRREKAQSLAARYRTEFLPPG